MTNAEAFTGPTTELLQELIRNACVNDGTPDSGDEVRNADLLQTYLEGAGLDVERFDSRPGRTSIVARIEGTDPTAPTLCLMGHTDVVPVNPDGWSRDPFGGELIDGEVWGRGAIDMLNITSSMAVAFRRLATEGFRPKGTLIYFGVADEEAGGHWGAEYMIDEHWDAVGADYVLTETGGWSAVGRDGVRHVTVNVAEKGLAWRRLRVHGTPGHGSMPYGADNALITSAEIIRRLVAYRPQPNLDDLWTARVASMDLPDDLRRRADRPGPHRRRAGLAADRVRPGRPRLHAHHDLAQRHPRRPEDEHDPRRHRHRRRHPHRARRHQGGRRRLLRRDPRRARRPRRDLPDPGVRVDPLPHRQPAVGRPADPHPGRLPRRRPRAGHHHRRHRRPLLPRQGRGRLRHGAVLARR